MMGNSLEVSWEEKNPGSWSYSERCHAVIGNLEPLHPKIEIDRDVGKSSTFLLDKCFNQFVLRWVIECCSDINLYIAIVLTNFSWGFLCMQWKSSSLTESHEQNQEKGKSSKVSNSVDY